MNFKPLHANVVVKPIADETVTKLGLVLPDTVNKEKPEKGLNTLLKRVNSEPNLRERQEMLTFTSEILQEVEGIQPSTTNDIEKLVRNLKECDLYLENELSQMEFEEQASPTLSDIKPLKLQKEIVLSQREQIKEITEDLLEVPVPPKPFGGAAAKDLLGQVDKNYVSVL
ncbi:MAG: Chaperonin 10 Kd subunit, partial [Actinomycetota bacterium]